MSKISSSPIGAMPYRSIAIALLFTAICGLPSLTLRAQCILVCNDQIQIVVPPNGSREFLPDDMLEGDYQMFCPNAIFQAQVNINNSWQPASGNFIFETSHVGNTYLGRVRDLNTANACWGNITVVGGQPVGVKEALVAANAGALKLTPNPASEKVTVLAPIESPYLTLRIFDAQGRAVHQQSLDNGGSLDIHHLAIGIYSMQALTPSGTAFSGIFEKVR